MKKFIEPLKTALIVLLLISAVFLAGKSGLGDSLMLYKPVNSAVGWINGLFGGKAPEPDADSAARFSEAARPVVIAAVNETGRLGVQYDSKALDELYDSTAHLLAEALGTASQPAEVSNALWESALQSRGLYYCYFGELPLSAVAVWLGSSFEFDYSASRIAITAGEGEANVSLYFSDGEGYFMAQTSAEAEGLFSSVSELRPNDARFAFELAEAYSPYKNVDPCSMILPDSGSSGLSFNSVDSRGSLGEEERRAVFEALSLNPYSESINTDSGGGSVYLVSGNILRLGVDGTFLFQAQDDGADFMDPSLFSQDTEVIEACLGFALKTAGRDTGDARLFLCGFSRSEDGSSCTASFSYFVNGLPVSFASGDAVTMTVTNGKLTYFSMAFRRYTDTGYSSLVLLPLYAAAVMPKNSGDYLVPGYIDSPDTELFAEWLSGIS